MIKIDVEVDDKRVRDALNRLIRAAGDLSPAMIEIAGHLEDSVHESLERQADPATGAPWQPLEEDTVAERRRKGFGDRILERSGALFDSIHSEHDAQAAVAGTNLIYAATHQFGSGDDGRNIPARPYLGLWDEHRDEVLDALTDHLARASQGSRAR